jgi:hypothetical protein
VTIERSFCKYRDLFLNIFHYHCLKP